jgi:hypothetical protein
MPSSPKPPAPQPIPAPPASQVNMASTNLMDKAPDAPSTAGKTPFQKKKGKNALKIELDQSNLSGGQSGVNIP